jgi:transcriptional regulator GlxA family with amidase domain
MHELPVWPPLLATRGPGSRSTAHAHHAMHFVIALEGELSVRVSAEREWLAAAGVLTAPDAVHSIEASGLEVLLVFLDPESAVGASLTAAVEGSIRTISDAERTELVRSAHPQVIMRADGAEWTRRAVETLGGRALRPPSAVHPRVRKLLRLLRAAGAKDDLSLERLASSVGLSPGRLMHVFTTSIGIPLRPYLAWLKLQRAAAAIASGAPLASAAQAAGFADAAHMSRTFRAMFGVSPSSLRPRQQAAS